MIKNPDGTKHSHREMKIENLFKHLELHQVFEKFAATINVSERHNHTVSFNLLVIL